MVLDPPYDYANAGDAVLDAARGSAPPDGLLMLEHASRVAPPQPAGLTLTRTVTSGDSALTILRMSTRRTTPRIAVYPGSFDPLTNGHVDIIERGARIFDSVIVAVLVNVEKTPLFSVDERVAMIREVFNDHAEREVDTFNGLLVDYAQRKKRAACSSAACARCRTSSTSSRWR